MTRSVVRCTDDLLVHIYDACCTMQHASLSPRRWKNTFSISLHCDVSMSMQVRGHPLSGKYDEHPVNMYDSPDAKIYSQSQWGKLSTKNNLCLAIISPLC